MVSHRVEGLLVAPVERPLARQPRPLLRRAFPFVLIDRAVPGLECDLVESDSVGGARRLVEHLLSLSAIAASP